MASLWCDGLGRLKERVGVKNLLNQPFECLIELVVESDCLFLAKLLQNWLDFSASLLAAMLT